MWKKEKYKKSKDLKKKWYKNKIKKKNVSLFLKISNNFDKSEKIEIKQVESN